LKHSQALHEELLEMRSLKSEGSGKHDDLTMALALACWRARKVGPPPLTGEGVPKPKPFGFQNIAFGPRRFTGRERVRGLAGAGWRGREGNEGG
jgi:hypothetical protein